MERHPPYKYTMLGHDTEFFLLNSSEEAVPAHTIFPSKEEGALPVSDNDQNIQGYIFRDGYAVEVNSWPGDCRGYLWDDFAKVADHANFMAKKAGYHLTTIPYVDIDKVALRSAPKDVQRFGCSPTFSAYSADKTRIRANALSVPFRTAATHFHMGIQEPLDIPHHPLFEPLMLKDVAEASKWVKMMDFVAGIPLTWLLSTGPYAGLEYKRRRLYGKAGEFRIHHHPYRWMGWRNYEGESTEFGPLVPTIEYRVISTAAARHPALWGLAPGLIRDFVYGIYHMPEFLSHSDEFFADVQKAINTGEGIDKLFESWLSFINEIIFAYKKTDVNPEDWHETIEHDHMDIDQWVTFRQWVQELPWSGKAFASHDGHTGLNSIMDYLEMGEYDAN